MAHEQKSPDSGVGVSRSAVRGFSGARLRRYRTGLRLTIDDLADAAEVSSQTVSAWETGRAAPTPELLARVAGVLKVANADLAPIPEDQLRLSDLRSQAGLTQGTAAKALGTSATVLGRIEKGRKEYDEAWGRRMAELYSVPLNLLSEVWERDRQKRAAHVKEL